MYPENVNPYLASYPEFRYPGCSDPLQSPTFSGTGQPAYIRSAIRTAAVAAPLYPGSKSSFAATSPRPATADPLRICHVSSHMIPAGIDRWLFALHKFSDPAVLSFRRFVVTTDQVDYDLVAECPVPVEIGGAESVRVACRECDVLLISDSSVAVDEFLDVRPPLCIFVAHGDCVWTKERLDAFTPVIDHVVAVSGVVQANMCSGHSSTVISNGVDPSRLVVTHPRQQIRESLGFRADDFVVGFTGRYSTEKRIDQLIHALAQLPLDVRALLVGFGHLRKDLIELANEIAPGRCVFRFGGDDLGNLYHAMDSFCMVSESEGHGLAMMEAMACGVPLIARPVGFVPELIQSGRNGIIVEGDPQSIASAVASLKAAPTWAHAVAQAGQETARVHGYASVMAQRYQNLLLDLWKQKTL